MRVLVCIKQILDPEIPARNFQVDPASPTVIPGDAALVINPFDLNAIEVALQLKDREKSCMVTALTLGGETCGKALRHTLAMGCDEAIWLQDPTFAELDSSGIAAVIARGIQISSPVMKYFFKARVINYWRRNYPFRPDRVAGCRSWFLPCSRRP